MSKAEIDITPVAIECILEIFQLPGTAAYALPGQNRLTIAPAGTWHAAPFERDGLTAPFYQESTSYEQYMSGCWEEIRSLAVTGGKTVYSRVVAGHCHRQAAEVLSEYFRLLPDTFRFIFATADGLIWAGASPELLVDNNRSECRLYSCALAGTRPADTDPGEPWDSKNLEEHQIVADYIVKVLAMMGLSPEAGDTDSRLFGRAVHLHTPVRARATDDVFRLLDRLSPTPALAGYPVEKACGRISVIERHRRGYYGGYIAVDLDGTRTVAYVNLRSMRMCLLPDGTFKYNIFVGGGLTAASMPQSEWGETELKAAPLLDIINSKVMQPL